MKVANITETVTTQGLTRGKRFSKTTVDCEESGTFHYGGSLWRLP